MGAGNYTGGAILPGKVIEHPDAVRNPVSLLIGDRSHVGMQRLYPVGVRVRRTQIQAAEFEARSEDVSHWLEYVGHHNHALEDFALVHEIGEAPRLWFPFELGACLATFFSEKLVDARAQCPQQVRTHEVLKHHVSELVKAPLMRFGHGPILTV